VNSSLLGELDLSRLTAKYGSRRPACSRERGYVLLRQPDGSLSVHTSRSRSGDTDHADFSRSIAKP